MKKIIKKEKKAELNIDALDRIFGAPAEHDAKKASEAENVSLIIKEWFSPLHIRQKTRLSKHQVLSISILQSIADKYRITTLKNFLNEYRTTKLSEDGKSSIELENILKARMPEIQETNLERLSKFLE